MEKHNFGYSDPVARLLTIGDPREIPRNTDWRGGLNWPEYPADYGFTPEHAPDLIRMATDEALNQAMADSKEVWAPLHAWRALGQMKITQATQPLLSLLHRVDDEEDDWVAEELPDVMGMIGPAAIPAITEYLASPRNRLWARVAASTSLEKIVERYPETRETCITALTTALENFNLNDELLNGEIITILAEMKAVEAAPLVELAYKADRVDETILGDWEDFQVEVGLLEERLTDPEEDLDFNPFLLGDEPGLGKQQPKKEEKKDKNKRRQAKESRKKNQKRKK
jgi:hypothetical protein